MKAHSTPGSYAPGTGATILSGWGRSHRSACVALQAGDDDELARSVDEPVASRTHGYRIARGAGSSYGDAATISHGTVIDMRARNTVHAFDPGTGVLHAEAGVTLADVLARTLPYGWMLPVMPGTTQVTLGGAVAADVHGKNHPRNGSFGRHVLSLGLLTARQRVPVRLSPDQVEFWSTVGGLGLTGVITDVCVQLQPVHTSARARRTRGADLGEVLDLLQSAHARADGHTDVHSVAWVDGTATGHRLGRGIVETTQVSLRDPRTTRPAAASPAHPRPRLRHPSQQPRSLPFSVLNPVTARIANRARWLLPLSATPAPRQLPGCLLPLRHSRHWPALFGPAGLIQYQFAVSTRRQDVLRTALDVLQRQACAPTLTSLKQLGPADRAPLTFGREGWTLAMDFPRGAPRLLPALAELDTLLADAGGRVYLAKDSRLSPAALRAMYPELPAWQRTRDAMDPGGLFASDLSTRLHLAGGTG